MAVDANALVTYANTKTFLKLPSDTDQTLIEWLIDCATFAIEGWCGRLLKARAYTDALYDGTGTGEIRLREFPVNSVSAVDIMQTVSSSGVVWEAQDITNLEIDPWNDGVLVWRDFSFLRGRLNVRLTYNAGYTAVPNDLQVACYMTVKHWRKAQDRIDSGVASLSVDGQTQTFTREDLPVEVKRMLSKFRRFAYAT